MLFLSQNKLHKIKMKKVLAAIKLSMFCAFFLNKGTSSKIKKQMRKEKLRKWKVNSKAALKILDVPFFYTW